MYDLYFLSAGKWLDQTLLEKTFVEMREILSKDVAHNPSSELSVDLRKFYQLS